MPIVIEDKSRCCGCMACVNACPVDALQMETDANGFLYPKVNMEACIKCGLCKKACDFVKEERNAQKPHAAYSLVHKNQETLKKSTSGGAFTALSDLVLREGGIVVGAAMGDDFAVAHRVAENAEQRDAMRGSLYVQSYIGDAFRRVREALKADLQVLFIGAPCQTAGLLSFLGKPYEKLITVEFLCHGVPNNDLLRAHVAFLEQYYKKKAVKYSFRGKRYGWNHGIDEITFADGSYRDARIVQSYTRFFQRGISLRPSCQACTYRCPERCADITIGDFWGVEALIGKADYKGVSLLYVNSGKGMAFVERARGDVVLSCVPIDKVFRHIASVAPKQHPQTAEFWQLYREKGYAALVDRYCDISLKSRVIFKLKKIRRKWLSRK